MNAIIFRENSLLTISFSLCLLFVTLASGYDLWFTLQFMDSFTYWEANLIALAVYKLGGPITICLYKILLTWFFVVVTTIGFLQNKWITLLAVWLATLLYCMLMVYYVYIWSVL